MALASTWTTMVPELIGDVQFRCVMFDPGSSLLAVEHEIRRSCIPNFEFAAGGAADAAIAMPPAVSSQPDSSSAPVGVSAGLSSSLPATASNLRQPLGQQATLETETDSSVKQMVQSWHMRSPSPPKKKRGRPPSSPTGPPPTAKVVSPARNCKADGLRSQDFLRFSSAHLPPAASPGGLPDAGANLEGSPPC